ncbi:MAG: rhodanese-like domain-containing protein [Verrucomicrobiae bacterium]
MKTIKAGEVAGGDFLLDVRTRGEFGREHIEGSRCDPLQDLDAGAWAAKLDVSRRCVVVCQGGIRAGQAAEMLEAAGAKNLVVLERGINGWKAAGRPCVRGGRRVLPLDCQVRIASGLIVVVGVVLGALGIPAGYLAAGLMGAGLICAGITNWCGLAILVGKMPWNEPDTAATCCNGGNKTTSCCGKEDG